MFTYTDLVLKSSNDSNPDLILNLLFGITGGLLTLVGLISIFVTLNTQHNIQRAKEILWSLQSLEIDFPDNNETKAKKFGWYVRHYNDLTKVGNLIKLVIWISIITIGIVGASWMLCYNLLIKEELTQNEATFSSWFIGVALISLVSFIWMLGSLFFLTKMGDIPKSVFDEMKSVSELNIDVAVLFCETLGVQFGGTNIILHNSIPMEIKEATLRYQAIKDSEYNLYDIEKEILSFPKELSKDYKLRKIHSTVEGLPLREAKTFLVTLTIRFDDGIVKEMNYQGIRKYSTIFYPTSVYTPNQSS